MTVGNMINNDFSFNAGLIIRGYNSGKDYVNTIRDGWGDVPFDIVDKTIVALGVEDYAVLLMIDD